MKPIVPSPPRYFTPSAPESTVLNYALAWERRDSTMIDSVLTDDYAGTSVDMTDPLPATLMFTRADEIRAVGGLALDLYVSSVAVSLGTGPWIRLTNVGDPPEWVTLQRTGVMLSITNSHFNDLHSNNSTLEFKLKPIVSASGTTWKIIHWSEIHT